MPSSLENELTLLIQYDSELEDLRKLRGDEDPLASTRVERQTDQKLQIYWNQIQLVRTQFPDCTEANKHESEYWVFRAFAKLYATGFMRRMSAREGGPTLVGLASAAVAKQQENKNAIEALALFDKALTLWDEAGTHLAKAEIYRKLNRTGDALKEANYVIERFPEDERCVLARQMRDAIQTPPKSGCFVATAVCGSTTAPEVVFLTQFRDQKLCLSHFGKDLRSVLLSNLT
jgi:tetratricopeptide (TPR) repeat protein